MTIQQQAYNLIDSLPEDSVTMLVKLMAMLPKKKESAAKDWEIGERALKSKRRAFQKMQELRKITSEYSLGDLAEERERAMIEKYGELSSRLGE